MKTIVRHPTPYGMIQLEVLECNDCGAKVVEDVALNWVNVQTLNSEELVTLGSVPQDMHFCSWQCFLSLCRYLVSENTEE